MTRKPTEDDGLTVLRENRSGLRVLAMVIVAIWVGMALAAAIRWVAGGG